MTEEEIKALARILDRVDYYRLIKAEREASDSEIRAAYHQARRRFHPTPSWGKTGKSAGPLTRSHDASPRATWCCGTGASAPPTMPPGDRGRTLHLRDRRAGQGKDQQPARADSQREEILYPGLGRGAARRHREGGRSPPHGAHLRARQRALQARSRAPPAPQEKEAAKEVLKAFDLQASSVQNCRRTWVNVAHVRRFPARHFKRDAS